MSIRTQGWADLQRQEGSDFLKWINENQTLRKKFDILANALRTLLRKSIRTADDARDVWTAAPEVLSRCNEQATYEKHGAPVAYAWLHLLDRYVRTWLALERLVKENCLPMGKYGVRALDVGTGPGPSAFAIHDFYAATVEFSEFKKNSRWRQPTDIICFEFDAGTNHLRHNLAEIMFGQSQGESKGVLAMCGALPDFSKFHPTQERKQSFQYLRNKEDEYYDEVENEWTSELQFSPNEANDMAQSLHRYRLFVFGNFLTTPDIVDGFEQNLLDILRDARPGSVILVLGAKGGSYAEVYKTVDRLAVPAGFQLKVEGCPVSSSDSEVSDRVYEEGQQFYEFLKEFAPNECNNEEIREIKAHFEKSRSSAPCSQVWVYRK